MGFDMNAFSLAGKKAIVTGGAKKTGLCYGMAVAPVSYTHLTLPTTPYV